MAFWLVMATILAAYAVKLLKIVRGLDHLCPGDSSDEPTISVIVPARNEEDTIRRCLDCLLKQDYPSYLFEIIVVDDRSTDRTAAIVDKIRAEHPTVRLVQIDQVPDGVAPKKHAITRGIERALGSIIVTTDADCIQPAGWLSGMIRYFEPGVGVVVGHTRYTKPRSWFQGLQAIDYLSHRIISAGAIGNGEIISGTGSNLAYRGEVWREIGGFGDSDALVSGDDDLFLHRVKRLTDWKIVAATTEDTFVETEPVPSVNAFLRQRARWASKLTGYNIGLKPFLFAAGALMLGVMVVLPLIVLMPRRMAAFVPLIAAKMAVDYRVMNKGTEKLGQRDLMKYFWVGDVVHSYYIMISAIWGVFGRFTWKGTTYRRRA